MRGRRLLGLLSLALLGVCGVANAAPDASAPVAPGAIPTLEPAPRLEMRDYAPYRAKGTASVTGTLRVTTAIFGDRVFSGTPYRLIPDTPYSEYVAHQFRDAWFRVSPYKIDRGASQFLLTGRSGRDGRFTVTHLPAGRYLVFATISDGSALDARGCVVTYPGFDERGVAVRAAVASFCYRGVRRDVLFAEGTVDVASGETAVVTLHVDGETAE